jgi:type IV secretion system protein VirB9
VRVYYAAAILLAGCASMQPQAQPNTVIPASLTNPQTKHIDVPADPLATLPPKVRDAILSGEPKVLHEGFTTLFPYDPHSQPTVFCQPLRVTEIVLAPGETIKDDSLASGDTARWDIKATENRVLVKPKEPGIATDLIAVTDKRSYHFTLKTHVPYMPQVAFYYPEDVRLAEAERRTALQEAARQAADPPQSKPLNFAYSINGPNVPWMPVQAFDDGEREYIQFPNSTQGADMPTLMVRNGNEQSLVNYQVKGQYFIADRLYHEAALTSGTGTSRQVVRITADGR